MIDTAVRQSEVAHIEHTLLNDEIVATDLEATQDEILRQIARESYLQWLHEQEKQSTMDSTVMIFYIEPWKSAGGNDVLENRQP